MHAITIRHVILIACCLAAAPALAGVAGQSSGVTSTIGNQGTDASPEVQQQSAGFVDQNQQLQNAQNSASPTGIVVPVVANVAGAAGARGAANAAGPDAGGKPGDPNSASATPATPPPPPPPPPTYVSVVKHLTPGSDSDPSGTTAVVPVAVATPSDTQAPAVAPGLVKTDAPPPAPTKAPAPVVSAPVNAAANAEKIGANERAMETGVVSGGRGPAPDGYTFYVGFGIALLLLVIAFGAYVKSKKDEAARRL
jgi:hypothetical protein